MDDLDLENREPCPDGRCVGVIGLEGRCGECGASHLASPAGAPSHEAPPAGPADEADLEPVDLDSRVPCSNDLCVGIIGTDGRCGTCGAIHDE